MEVFKLERVSYYEYYSGKSIKVYAYDGHGNQTDVRQVQVRFKYEYNGSKWVLNPYNPDHSPYNQLYYSEDGNISFNTLDKYKKEFEKEEEIQTYRFFIRYAPVNSDNYYPAVEMRFAFSGVFVCNGKRYFAQSYSFIDITKDNKESIAPNIRFFDFLKCKDNSYIEVGRDMTGDELLQYKTAIVSIDKLYKTKGVNLPVYPGFFLTKLKPADSNNLYAFDLTIPEVLDKNNTYYENSLFPQKMLGFESIGYRAQGSSIIGPQNKSRFPSSASDGSYYFNKKPGSSLNFKGFKGDYSNCLPIYLPDEENGNPDFNLLVNDDRVEINGVIVFRAANGFKIKNLIIGQRNLINLTDDFFFTNGKGYSSNNFYPLLKNNYDDDDNEDRNYFGYYEKVSGTNLYNWNIDSKFRGISLLYSFRAAKPTVNFPFSKLWSAEHNESWAISEETRSSLKSEWFDIVEGTSGSGITTSVLAPLWQPINYPKMGGTLSQGYSIEYFYKNSKPRFKLIPTCFSSMKDGGQYSGANVQYLQYNIQTNQIFSTLNNKAYFPGSRKQRTIMISYASGPVTSVPDEGPNYATCKMWIDPSSSDSEKYYGCGFISINSSNEWANIKEYTNPITHTIHYNNDPSLLNPGTPKLNDTPKIVFVELEKTE